MPKLILPISLLLLLPSIALANSKPPDPYFQGYLDYCQGHFEKGHQFFDKMIAKDSEDFEAYYDRHFFLPSDINDAISQIKDRLSKGEKPESQRDKLLFTEALLYFRDPDFKKMENILDFVGKGKDIESARLELLGVIKDFEGKSDSSYRDLEESFAISPTPNRSVLAHLLFAGDTHDENTYFRLKYKPYIQDLDPRDPWRNYLQTRIDEFEGKLPASDALPKFKQIYDSCPVQLSFKLSYALQLWQLHDDEQAYQLLKSIMNEFKWYPPYLDLYLGELCARTNRLDEAEKHFERVRASSAYFSREELRGMGRPEASVLVRKMKGRVLWALGGIAGVWILVVIGSWFFYLRRKRRAKQAQAEAEKFFEQH